MKKVVIVPRFSGGLEKARYQEFWGETAREFAEELAKRGYNPENSEDSVAITKAYETGDFEVVRAGEDWIPEELAKQIRQMDGEKMVICISLGAMVGNIITKDEDTDVYPVCPFLGNEFNRRTYPRKLRGFFRGLARVCMIITQPFRRHRWYPLFGGTKPDGHFLSAYALVQQLWYSFRKTPRINPVAGVIYSKGDTTIDPEAVLKHYTNAIVAKRADGGDPYHANFREEGRSFGKKAKATAGCVGIMGEDAKAYARALAQAFLRKFEKDHLGAV